MKINLKILIILLLYNYTYGQNTNPSVGGAMAFNNNPVDLNTGIPNVSIPLYSMPTRSKEININLSLNYHPASVSSFGRRLGNCGRGWNLNAGGAIGRHNFNNFASGAGYNYDFSFMGLSGTFSADISNGWKVISGDGSNFVIEAILAPVGYNILEFLIYDDNGYKYRFMAKDIIYVPDEDGDLVTQDDAYQLNEIYDSNNNLLVSFSYDTYQEAVYDYSESNWKFNTLNVLKNIVVDGFGKIELDSSQEASADNPEDGVWSVFQKMTVFDALGNNVKTFDFIQDGLTDSFGKFVFVLTEVQEDNQPGKHPSFYDFFYRPLAQFELANPYFEGIDEWGYYNNTSSWCDRDHLDYFVDPKNITAGVLEKMTLPTGGCIIYNYEANTYSFENAEEIGLSINGEPDPNWYYDLLEPKSINHYTKNYLGGPTQDAILSFTLSQPARVYFKFGGVQSPPGQIPGDPGSYPDYELVKNDNPGGGLQFTFHGMGDGLHPNPWGNQDNLCLGVYVDLVAANYKIKQTHTGGYARAYTLTPIPNQKWWYGGGIRIKSIAYFSDSNVPQNYFELSPNGLATPAKLTNYKYNIFGNDAMSSGNKQDDANAYGGYVVRYKNVSVFDGLANGKTEYTFLTTAMEYSGNSANTGTIGKLKTKKVYLEGDLNPQLESNYEYEWIEARFGPLLYTDGGWAVPKKITNIEYYPDGKTESQDTFVYDALTRKLKQKVSTTSRSSQSVITNNYYNDFSSVSANSKYRIALDYSEQLLGSTLLSTSKVEYLNNWTDNGATNVSYLPSQIKQSKGAGVLEVKSKITRYDKYGYALETEIPGGTKTSYIYAYDNTMLVAEIVNMAYSDIPQALISGIQNATRAINPVGDPGQALDSLRNATQLANAMITTYTYKPLVGILTKTDARGYKISYEYDSNNRQTIVKDHQGNIITENVYHTKGQN